MRPPVIEKEIIAIDDNKRRWIFIIPYLLFLLHHRQMHVPDELVFFDVC